MASSDFKFLLIPLYGLAGGFITFVISLVPITLIFFMDTRPAWLSSGRLEVGISALWITGMMLGLLFGVYRRRGTMDTKVKNLGTRN